jgi:ketosteroid isomerase-like protein
MRSIPIALAVLVLSACGPDSANVDAEIRELVRGYVTSTDIGASLGMMDESASSITGDGTILSSRDRIKEHANRHSAAIRDQRITLGGIEVRRLGTTHALATAPFSATISALPHMALAEGAVTVVLAKRDSGWKVVHSHYSYPAVRRP